MITIHELLKDPTYRKFFCKVPKLPAHYRPENKPWRLLVLKRGSNRWAMKRFSTYQEAFAVLKKLLPTLQDAALGCPGFDFEPPLKTVKIKGKFHTTESGKKIPVTRQMVWKPTIPMDEIEPHHWCPYCRRPTIFRLFDTHQMLTSKKLGGVMIDPTLLRCTICGVSERLVNLRRAA